MPSATAAVFLATGAVTVAQFAFPEVFEALRRDPGALASGEWWRALSPLLVQSPGRQALVTVPAVAALGIPVERIYGAKDMLALYLVPVADGEGLGYARQPHGAGNSIAALGLACGLGSWLFLAAQEKGRPRPLLNRVRVRGAAVPAGAVADTAVRDIHGLPTLTGAAMGAGLLLRRRSRACGVRAQRARHRRTGRDVPNADSDADADVRDHDRPSQEGRTPDRNGSTPTTCRALTGSTSTCTRCSPSISHGYLSCPRYFRASRSIPRSASSPVTRRSARPEISTRS
ncbi:hypothetical protein ACPCBC_22180 [Streptomyces incarnatus]